MTLSVWRYAHLTLALSSFLFLALASITGVILAVDAIDERVSPYGVNDFDEISLVEALDVLRKTYPEITEIVVDHNQFVIIQAIDAEGEDVYSYIDPRTGKILGQPQKKNDFIQWTTALHRSLFLKEIGRFFVGLIAFLLMLISISGAVLIIQRQQGIRRFFAGLVNENFLQYAHVVTGRLSLIPIIIVALSGTYLSLARFDLLPKATQSSNDIVPTFVETSERTGIKDFPAFQNIALSQVQKIEFPFSDEPGDYYTLKLKDRELMIDQVSGNIFGETQYPMTMFLERLSLDLHTGRTNVIWALVLGLASLNILFFIYSGFAMTLKRRAVTIRNKYKPLNSEFIILVGSENGSTLRFADAIHQQLLSNKITSYLTEMNKYEVFPVAKHLLIFTSTHGIGSAPSNATEFVSLVQKYQQSQTINTTVVGFGSRAYDEFCGYALEVNSILAKQAWAKENLSLHTIDDKSPEQFTQWVRAWREKNSIPLDNTPALYDQKPSRLQKMTVVKTTKGDDQTLIISLRPGLLSSYTSGDLLAIYPEGRERLYSIGKVNNSLQLAVKLYRNGLGSRFLDILVEGSVVEARIVRNAGFHFRENREDVVMICNGTGIAPFLGMIQQHSKKYNIHLYAGFRNDTALIHRYRELLDPLVEKTRLNKLRFAFSRESHSQYVMDLIREDSIFFAEHLKTGGSIMICGSLAMKSDVERVLDDIVLDKTGKELSWYIDRGQVIADCY